MLPFFKKNKKVVELVTMNWVFKKKTVKQGILTMIFALRLLKYFLNELTCALET